MTPLIKYSALRELILTRVREFFREPEAVFWVYGFPVILAIGLGIAFRSSPIPVVHVGIIGGDDAPAMHAALESAGGYNSAMCSESEGRVQLASGKLDILVKRVGEQNVYIFDPARGDSRYAREKVDSTLQRAAGRADAFDTEEVILKEPGARYIDFLLPGLMGMNLIGGGIYGVGFVIVDMRVRKLLKRFLATPMRRRDFFIAVLTSRMLFTIPEFLFLFLVATFGFGMPFRGSPLALALVLLVCAFSFSGIGLLIATRARKLETVSGLINLVMIPMWLLGGIFFSTERFPEAMQPVIQFIPLTAANDALRSIILDGASLWSQLHELGTLLFWGLLSFIISLKIFRWM